MGSSGLRVKKLPFSQKRMEIPEGGRWGVKDGGAAGTAGESMTRQRHPGDSQSPETPKWDKNTPFQVISNLIPPLHSMFTHELIN